MNNQIKKPKGVILQIFGVTSCKQFEKTLDKYFETQLSNYLKTRWNEEKLSKLVNKLRDEVMETNQVNPSVPFIEQNDKSIDSIVKSIAIYADWVSKNNGGKDFVKKFLKHR